MPSGNLPRLQVKRLLRMRNWYVQPQYGDGPLHQLPSRIVQPEDGQQVRRRLLAVPTGSYHYSTVGVPSCAACGTGTYNPNYGQVQCLKCPAGTYNGKTGSNSSAACLPCPKGWYHYNQGQSVCAVCPVGTYNPSTGQVGCKYCPPGTYNAKTGNITIDACLPCPVGTYHYGYGMSSCAKCVGGQFNPFVGQTMCQPCPAGTYSAALGANSSSTCLPCATWNVQLLLQWLGGLLGVPCGLLQSVLRTKAMHCLPCWDLQWPNRQELFSGAALHVHQVHGHHFLRTQPLVQFVELEHTTPTTVSGSVLRAQPARTTLTLGTPRLPRVAHAHPAPTTSSITALLYAGTAQSGCTTQTAARSYAGTVPLARTIQRPAATPRRTV